MTQAQRKQGMGGLFRPVSWNKGRRFTSPGPEVNSANKNVGIQNYEVYICVLEIMNNNIKKPFFVILNKEIDFLTEIQIRFQQQIYL